MKVVINADYGGFSLSKGIMRAMLKKRFGIERLYYYEETKLNERSAIDYDFVFKKVNQAEDSWGFVTTLQDFGEELDSRIISDSELESFYKSAGELSDMEIKISKNRSDPYLIELIETVGVENAGGGKYTTLSIVEIPDDVQWHIEEYDGSEWVSEDHRTWR